MNYLNNIESGSQPATGGLTNQLNYNPPGKLHPGAVSSGHTTGHPDIFIDLIKHKSYSAVPGWITDHILLTADLSALEKLFYLLADSLSLINDKVDGIRTVGLGINKWAKYLNCSRVAVLTLQQSLVSKGYFTITRSKDEHRRKERNLITTTLPLQVRGSLLSEEDKKNCIITEESSWRQLLAKKPYIPINYQLIKAVTGTDAITAQLKIMFFDLYNICYKNYLIIKKKANPRSKKTNFKSGFNGSGFDPENNFFFITSFKELAERYKCSTSLISKYIKMLNQAGFIKAVRFHKKTGPEYKNRQDQSMWRIELTLPDDIMGKMLQLDNRTAIRQHQKNIIQNPSVPCFPSDQHDLNQLQDQKIVESGCNSSSEVKVHKFNHQCEQILLRNIKDLKIRKEYKSNLEEKQKVLFNHFLQNSEKDNCINLKETDQKHQKIKKHRKKTQEINEQELNEIQKISQKRARIFERKFRKKAKEFNIAAELIRKKLKELPGDKADKARRFAYSIFTKKLATGYAATIGKHELAKQLICHAATWKPSKLGTISREQQIDIALTVAWKSIRAGTWEKPMEYAKAQLLQREFSYYRRKYQESGIISAELTALESATEKLLKTKFIDLKGKITRTTTSAGAADTLPAQNSTPGTGAVNQDNSDYNTMPACNRDIELPPFLENQKCYLSYNSKAKTLPLNPDSTCIDQAKNQAEDEAHHNISVSKTPDSVALLEQQKYLRITTLEDGKGMLIKTINDGEYLFKLKSIESGEGDETIMTLDKVRLKSFIHDFADGSFTAISRTAKITSAHNDPCHESQHLTQRDDIQNQKSSPVTDHTTPGQILKQSQEVHLNELLNSQHPNQKTDQQYSATDTKQLCKNPQNNPIQHRVITPDDINGDTITLWQKARKLLIDHYGNATDINWFSRLTVTENPENKTITLKAQSLFFHDWVKNNYLNTIIQVVEHISTTTGQYKVKLVM